MRRLIWTCILLLLLYPVPAAMAAGTPVEVDGHALVVDFQAGTITCEGEVYSFAIQGDSIRIDYPNGVYFVRTGSATAGYGPLDQPFSTAGYLSEDTLFKALEGGDTEGGWRPGSYAPLALLLLPLGIFSLAKPERAWYVSWGWRYKNAKPSDGAPLAQRLEGVVLVVIGIVVMVG